MPSPTIDRVNAADRAAFVARFGPVFEASPWVAEAVAGDRPFPDAGALHAAMVAAVEAAGIRAQLALIRAHPDLAGRAAIAGELTDASTREQAAAGLDRLTPAQFAELTRLNTAYAERFGFPFVVCAREHDAASIIAAAAARLDHDPDHERATALAEIAKIAWLRVQELTT